MNKRIIAALIAASGLVAFNASANDGTVNFIGDITDGACTVDVQNTGSSTAESSELHQTANRTSQSNQGVIGRIWHCRPPRYPAATATIT